MALAGSWPAVVRRWARPFDHGIPPSIHDRLLVAQWARLQRHMPELCIALSLTTIAAAVALFGELPYWQQFTPPAIILIACGVMMVRRRYRQQRVLADDARAASREIERAPWIAAGLGLVAGLWCVSAFVETEQYYCIVAPVFVALSVLMTASSLASVPHAALAAVSNAFAPIVIRMLAYPNLGIRSIAVMMVIIAALQLRLIHAKFAETVHTLHLEDELRALAETDPLTRLDNRRAFDRRLEAALAEGRDVAVATLDLDGFKPANDTYGHAAGDVVLVEVGRRLKTLFPDSPSIARLGGDEFGVILTGSGSGVADAIRAAVGLPVSAGDAVIIVSAGVGVARASEAGAETSALLRAADRALYADKAAHRRMRRKAAA
jgi:diguanylate cyclase